MIGAGIYAAAYPFLQKRVLHIGDFGDKTLIELVHTRNPWTVIISVAVIIIIILIFLERLP
jgi:uncharacterized protein